MLERRWFWLAWAVGVCLFGVVCGFAAVNPYFPGDFNIARHIQDLDDFGFGPIAWFANNSGRVLYATLITVAFAGVFAASRRPWEAALVLATFIPRGMRQLLSMAIARPRPSADLVHVTDHAAGYSFPSGHTAGAFVLFGALFVLAGVLTPRRGQRLAFQAFCLGMIVATGLARVYAGAHWPSDVLGGWAFGLLTLAPLLALYHRLATGRWQR